MCRGSRAHKEPTPYGKLLVDVFFIALDGTQQNMLIVQPLALLYRAFECSGFQALVLRRLLLYPSTHDIPWHLILYSDEVVPGNPLARANLRKV